MIRYLISIVDDEETIRDGLEIILSNEYEIDLFETAESFLSSIKNSGSLPAAINFTLFLFILLLYCFNFIFKFYL